MDPVISLLNEFKNLGVYPNNGYIKKISTIVEVDSKNKTIRKKNTFRNTKIKVINDRWIFKKGI